MTTPADLMTLNDVMARLRVSRATIYVLMERKGFPLPLKLGRSNRWTRFEVEAWLETQPRAQIRVREAEPARTWTHTNGKGPRRAMVASLPVPKWSNLYVKQLKQTRLVNSPLA